MIKLKLQIADNWNDLPSVWKIVKKVNPVDYKIDIKDKGLLKIVKPYLNTDYLREAQTGLFVSDNYVAATNSYQLIILPKTSNINNGIYNINPDTSKKQGKELYSLIDAKYPDIERIVNPSEDVYKVDVYKLKTYCEAVIKGKYCNNITYSTLFLINKSGKKDKIGFNIKYLIEVLESFLQLGHEVIYAGIQSKSSAVLFSTSAEAVRNGAKSIGKEIVVILMPLMVEREELGAHEMDFGTELLAYYSFTDDEIHNKDGSIAKFDINLDAKELPYISNEDINALQKVKGSKSLPILEVISVKDMVATATNLDIALSISNVDVEDGLYEIVSGAFKNETDYDISDFPRIKSPQESDKIGEIKANELALVIESAAPFVSDDDLRPVMQGVFLHKKYGKIKLAATNAHILISAAMDGNFEDTSKLSNIILREPKLLSAALKLMGTENVSVYFDNNDVYFKTSDILYRTQNIDGRYPDYERVIEYDTDKKIIFDGKKVIDVINTLKGEDAKKNLIFDLTKQNGKADLKLGEVKNHDYYEQKDLKISIDYKIEDSEKVNENDIALIMPINTNNDKQLAFNPKFLKTVLSVTNNEAELHYNSKRTLPPYYLNINLQEKKSPILRVKESISKAKSSIEEAKQPTNNEDILNTIAGLEFLAEDGNQDAIDTIEGLKLLI
jgi:DNA polymerase III sliding clamp (beta) subunit (PCNA family)